MIGAALRLVPAPWRWGALLAALAAAGAWHWWAVAQARREGADEVRGEWRAERTALAAAARVQSSMQAVTAAAATADFEARRATLERDHARNAARLADALARPLECPQGAPLVLADVLVPAAAVGRLRDPGPADPAGAGGADPGRP